VQSKRFTTRPSRTNGGSPPAELRWAKSGVAGGDAAALAAHNAAVFGGGNRVARLLAAAPAAILTAEFLTFDLAFYVGKPIGIDARLYLAATQAWLSGADPWSVTSGGIRFAAPPVTLLPFAPLAWLSPDAITALVIAGSMIAAVFIVRRLELPAWWLLFPPLVEGIWSGSVNAIVVALALTRLEWAAVLIKTYAGLPALVLGHTRQLAIAAVIGALTVALLPWQVFFEHDHASALVAQAGGGRSAWIAPALLLPISAVALTLLGRRRAAWLSVPVLWPATQFHYSTFALPARPSALAAGILAIPWPGAPVVAVVVEAAVRRGPELVRRLGAARLAGSSLPQEGDSVPAQLVQ
jgi:hypothetical protein